MDVLLPMGACTPWNGRCAEYNVLPEDSLDAIPTPESTSIGSIRLVIGRRPEEVVPSSNRSIAV